MTYEKLKKDGIFLGERDWHNNGIYSGTTYYYLYNDSIYARREPTNAFEYEGKTETFLKVNNVSDKLKKYRWDYWVVETLKSERLIIN